VGVQEIGRFTVADTIEALFLSGSNKLPVADEARGGLV